MSDETTESPPAPAVQEAAEPVQSAETAPLAAAAGAAVEALESSSDPRAVLGAAVSSAVRAWFDDCVRDSPVSRSTEAHNHLVGALPALAARIMREI